MINTYNIWQGNFSAIFLMRLQPGIFGEQYYFIAPLILLSAYMGFSIFFFYTALKKIFKADFRSQVLPHLRVNAAVHDTERFILLV